MPASPGSDLSLTASSGASAGHGSHPKIPLWNAVSFRHKQRDWRLHHHRADEQRRRMEAKDGENRLRQVLGVALSKPRTTLATLLEMAIAEIDRLQAEDLEHHRQASLLSHAATTPSVGAMDL